MIRLPRYAVSMTWSFIRYVWATGRWWIGLVMPGLIVAGVLVMVAKAAVPTIVYAFF